VKLAKCMSIGILVVLTFVSGFDGTAYAAHSKSPFGKQHRIKGNSSVFPDQRHKAKKLRNSKSHFRSPYSGGILYGKPVKQK